MSDGALERLPGVTYRGDPITDSAELAGLPEPLAELLKDANGVVAFRGGLHVRGLVAAPNWHSLRAAWTGDGAYWRHYNSMAQADVPFAEDALGDQFFLRGDNVWRLFAETDEAELISDSLNDFLASCEHDPVRFLALEPLLQLESEGHQLRPGELINAYPPFCTKEASDGVSLSAVGADERKYFLEQLAATMRVLPEGGQLEIKAEP